MRAVVLAASVLAGASVVMSSLPVPAYAQATEGVTITTTVVDTTNGLPVSNATVILYRGDTRVGDAKTNDAGVATFPNEQPAFYHVEIRAEGYGSGRSSDVVVSPGASVASIRASLDRASLSAGTSLQQIGSTSISGSRGLQTTSTINGTVDTNRLQRQNYARFGDALYVLPGINLNSQDSAVGDDLSLNVRGIGASETQIMLDGHPIGPFGAGGTAYNLQLSPYFALKNVQTIYGTGAQALYGVDAIGGAVNLQTLTPTNTPESAFQFGFGNQGKSQSGVQATGTLGGLGYAVASSVTGTYGQFAPGQRTQTGNLGADITDTNIAANTYDVSANYLLRDNVAKLSYAFSPKTHVSLTYYGAYSYDDKTGNGDNDNVAYDEQFYNAQQAAVVGQQIPAGDGSTPCAAYAGPSTQAFPIATNAGNQCYTIGQYSALTSGPAGGGPYRFQQDQDIDYTFRVNHQAGKHALSAFAYTDSFQVAATRTTSPSLSRFDTFGYGFSDDIVTDNNTFGIGMTGERQRVRGNNRSRIFPDLGQATTNFFVRDEFTVSPQVQLFANAWLKESSVTKQDTIDPRFSIVARPTHNDVVRFSVARADNFPSIQITGNPSSFTDPGAVNVKCGDLTGIGSAPGEGLQPERATDFELALGHRFKGDSQIQLSLYDTTVKNQIVNSTFILNQVPSLLGDPGFAANLQGYLNKINQQCPQYAANPLTSAGQLAPITTVSTNANAATGRFRGIEITGRARVSPRLYFDYTYDVQSAYRTDLSDFYLLNNGNAIPNAQLSGIPLQKATLGFDVNDGHGTEFRMDGFYVGDNNGYNRPSFTFFNAALTKVLPKTGTVFNLGVQNLFNQATQDYGLIGLGQYQPFNALYTAANAPVPPNALAEGSERFGLAPRAILFTVTQKVGGR